VGSAALQGKLWGRGADDWSTLQERMHLPLYRGVISALTPLQGRKVLDAGCGSGLALSLLQESGAKVSGIDAAPELAAIARQRATEADVRVGDIEDLPFEDGEFDDIVAFNALQYAASPMNALREMRRALQTDGRLAIGQWGDASRCETEILFKRLRELAPPPAGSPAPLALTGDGVLETRLVEAGFQPFSWGETEAPFEYPDLETCWRAMAAGGPMVRAIGAAGEAAVRKTVEDVFRPSTLPDGRVRQMNVFRWVICNVQPA